MLTVPLRGGPKERRERNPSVGQVLSGPSMSVWDFMVCPHVLCVSPFLK